jgi:hypothetical protein
MRRMANRKSDTAPRKGRRVNTQRLIFTVIGLLVILTFVLGMLK